MITKQYTILAAEGLHARPATTLIKLAKQFKSSTSLQKGDKIVKLNSMLNILSLGLKGGDVITMILEGDDEVTAAAAMDVLKACSAKLGDMEHIRVSQQDGHYAVIMADANWDWEYAETLELAICIFAKKLFTK